ncbi:MAG TPA: DMT family transporter [Burkholderiaceae bacterium]|nr:DMT family transporter [Burkholderiaceae bacterium]
MRVSTGIAFLAAAVACFAAMDTTTKAVSLTVPALMAVWSRNLFQVAAVAATLGPRRGRDLFKTTHPWLHAARGALLLLCSLSAFYAVRVMPVGEFTAIVLITPLVLTLLASRGERVPPLRWLLVFGGFAGAMMVIRPDSDQFNGAALLPLAIVAANTGYQWVTSRLAKMEDAGTMQFYTGVVGALLSGVALPWAWQTLSPAMWASLVLLGVLGTLGHFLLIHAYVRAPVAVLTPYLYLQIAFATLGGWLVFSYVPDAWSTAGILLIAVCGAGGTWLSQREAQMRKWGERRTRQEA